MGEVRHLQFESLSALLDGELPGQEAAAAREHLGACPACRADVASLARLEDELRLAPALSCADAAPFLSAQRDGEADAADDAIASRHLSRCTACREAASSWTAIESLVAGPLILPSARVDAAMAALTRTGAAPRGPRTSGPVPLGVAWRGAVVAVLGLAIAFGSSLAPGRPDVATPAEDSPAFIAAVQQVVFDRRTNTLYVAEPDAGAVNALNAADHSVRARIAVGGRPTALALNEAANRVIVLDSAAKRFTEIDTERNTVVGSTAIEVAGTPTSIQVDNGKIVVFTAVAAKTPTASAAATSASGNVAVFDPATKALETVRSVDAPTALVLPDPSGGRTLLVSPKVTTVVDASYRTIETLAGGVGAAFGHDSGRIAVLSSETDGARVSFYGENAPSAVRLAGRAGSIIGLPSGGFAVLLDLGGRGRIELLDAAGSSVGGTDVALSGRHLTYDAGAKRFTVVGDGASVAFAALPGTVAGVPTQSGAPSLAPAGTASPAPSGTPAPSATPSPAPSAPASRPPEPSAIAGVPAGAVRVAADLYRLPLADGRVPTLVASSAGRMWLVDQRNQLASVDTATGATFTVAPFPSDARIGALAAGLAEVYAVDTSKSRLFRFALKGERLTSHQLPFTDVSALTVAPDGTAWLAMPGTSILLAFSPNGDRVEAIDIGVRGAVALAADIGGRLWFSDGRAGIGSYDVRAAKLVQLYWPGGPAPSVLRADGLGQVWAGTATGEIHLLSTSQTGPQAALATRVGRPISALALDPAGQPWYLAPALQQAGFVYGPVRGAQPARLVTGPATGLAITGGWKAWLADPLGGFYIGAAEAAR